VSVTPLRSIPMDHDFPFAVVICVNGAARIHFFGRAPASIAGRHRARMSATNAFARHPGFRAAPRHNRLSVRYRTYVALMHRAAVAAASRLA
jgi:hypothetical protein